KSSLASNISRMIDFYNGEISRFKRAYPILQGKPSPELVNDFINRDPKFISWSSSLISSFSSSKIGSFDQSNLAISLSRPFSKQYLYFDGIFNHRTYQMPKIFPNSESKNLIIGLSGVGALNSFTVLISNALMDTCTADIRITQCFPLYLYDEASKTSEDDLFSEPSETGLRRDAITDAGFSHFKEAYP